MMNYNDGQVPGFEKFPGSSAESVGERVVAPEEDFEKSFKSGVPEFAGFKGAGREVAADKYGVAKAENNYYGETVGGVENEASEDYNAGIADAAALINYGLNAAARDLGVEVVVQKIKGFDASGREDPIGDLFEYLGVDSPEERREVREEGEAALAGETAFREGANNPGTQKSVEGAFQALDDMKELIAEVEGADPRYEELRAGARAAGKGYFEYAVSEFGVQGLTELFGVLAQQRERAEDAAAATDVEEEPAEVEVESDDKSEVFDGTEVENSNKVEAGEDRETLNPEILRKGVGF